MFSKSNPTNFQLPRRSQIIVCVAAFGMLMSVGCLKTGLESANSLGLYRDSSIDFAALNPPQSKIDSGKTEDRRMAELAGLKPNIDTNDPSIVNVSLRAQSPDTNAFGFPAGSATLFGGTQNNSATNQANSQTNDNQFNVSGSASPAPAAKKTNRASRIAESVANRFNKKSDNSAGFGGSASSAKPQFARGATSPAGGNDSGNIKQVQYPELATPDRFLPPGNGLNSPNVGSPNEMNPLIQPFERGGNAPIPFPANYADLDVYVSEAETGRINFGGAYNSDNGIVGQFTVDEKNFDITRLPRSFSDLFNGTAFRGAGQQFRLELVPGANVQRYMVSLTEPYLMGTDYSLSVSGYLFDRTYFDWDENRVGGRVSIGRRLTPDLSISFGLRGERVKLDDARLNVSPSLNAALGKSNLFLANVGLIRDTRDSQFNATEGTFFSTTLSQAFGDFTYTRGDLDFRTYKLLYERADGTGRHSVSFGTKLGFSGSDTPIYENYFAGGFSTMRGFDFRGVGPNEGGIRTGGEFQWLNTVEYQFPITQDDSVKGVVFCDFGTVEENIEINADNFRVAPGFGFRVSMPGLGIGAPLAFDFAFPIASADGDEEKVFSFYLGMGR
jgi:outer membrane protein insertion porin family